MAGLDKEETTSIVSALKEVMLRFGSTRWLNVLCGLCFLCYIVWRDSTLGLFCACLGTALVFATLLSFHFRPHNEVKP